MRCNTVIGQVVHRLGAYLQLDLLVARMPQCHAGVQALVAVGLRRADIILEPAGNHRIRRMHGAQRCVTLLPRRHHDAKRHDVG